MGNKNTSVGLENQPVSQLEISSSENSLPLVEPKISKLTFFLILLLAILSCGVTGYYFLIFKVSNKKQKIETKTDNTIAIPTTTIIPTITISPSMSPLKVFDCYEPKILSLNKTSKNGSEIIASPLYKDYFIFWNDYLFYDGTVNKFDENENVKVFSYNFKTGEKKNIYDEDSRKDFSKKPFGNFISRMQIIDNTLIISIGDYPDEGGTFYMTLPPRESFQKLSDGGAGTIKYWMNRYWILNSRGDACWSASEYSLIDWETKKVTKIATSKEGCAGGEEAIGVDKKNRMILADHSGPPLDSNLNSDGTYQYVIAIHLNNPGIKEGVIAKQDMPQGIFSIKYLENTDQLLLTGKDNYIYDFSSNTITKSNIPVTIPTEASYPNYREEQAREILKKLPSGYKFECL
jgi:hypothetical protein